MGLDCYRYTDIRLRPSLVYDACHVIGECYLQTFQLDYDISQFSRHMQI